MYATRDDYNTALKERRSVTAPAQQLLLDEARASRRNGRRAYSALAYGTVCGRQEGREETYAKRDTEDAIAARLALLEAADPSQQRPTPKDNANNRVDWIDA